jgi:hypothetical protein
MTISAAALLAAAICYSQESRDRPSGAALRERASTVLCELPLGMLKVELSLSKAQAEKISQIKSDYHKQITALKKAMAGEEGGTRSESEGREGERRVSPIFSLTLQTGQAISAILTEKQMDAAGHLGSHAESLAFAGIPLSIYDKLNLSVQQEAQLVDLGWQARSQNPPTENGELARRAAHIQAEEAAKQILTPVQVRFIIEYNRLPRREGGR